MSVGMKVHIAATAVPTRPFLGALPCDISTNTYWSSG